jgi:hypothetical protein
LGQKDKAEAWQKTPTAYHHGFCISKLSLPPLNGGIHSGKLLLLLLLIHCDVQFNG